MSDNLKAFEGNISYAILALPSILSASALKPSSLVISNLKCGWSLLVGHSSSSSDGGGSSSEVEAAPNKTQILLSIFHTILKHCGHNFSKFKEHRDTLGSIHKLFFNS